MSIEVKSDGENLIFEDYLKRKITISHKDYLDLITDSERQSIRPYLEECFSEPTEVWLVSETIDHENYMYSKYIKFYGNAVIIALVTFDKLMNYQLNNFYGYFEHNYEEVDKERFGKLIYSETNS